MYSPIGHSGQFCRVLLKVPLRDVGVNRRLAYMTVHQQKCVRVRFIWLFV